MHIMRTAIFLAVFLPIFSFAENSTRKALPGELRQGIVPNFFVLEKNGVNELFRDDIKEAVNKRKAKRVVLSFFAEGCLFCMEEFAILKDNKAELDKQGVLVYLIDAGDDIRKKGKKISEAVKTHAGGLFPLYFDPNFKLLFDFGLAKRGSDPNLPLTLILDSDLQAIGLLEGKMGDDFPQLLWSEL